MTDLPQGPECPRCGAEAAAEWAAITTWGAAKRQYIPASAATCPTAGCVDNYGSSEVAWPPKPGELTEQDRDWMHSMTSFGPETFRPRRGQRGDVIRDRIERVRSWLR